MFPGVSVGHHHRHDTPGTRLPDVAGVTHRWVDVAGLSVHVAEAGAGPPLLLLHAWPQHWFCWRRVVPLLSDRYRLIMPDLRGHGWSGAPRRGYEKEQLATDLLTLLDTLELDKVGLVGHDWGGWTGFGLASDTGALPGLPRVGHRPPVPASDVGQGGAIMAWRLSARSERTSGVSGDVASVATAGRRGDSGRHKPPTPSPTPTCGCMDPSCSSPTGPAPASRCTAPSCFGKSETRPLPTAASARAHPSPRRPRRSHRQSRPAPRLGGQRRHHDSRATGTCRTLRSGGSTARGRERGGEHVRNRRTDAVELVGPGTRNDSFPPQRSEGNESNDRRWARQSVEVLTVRLLAKVSGSRGCRRGRW